MRAKSCKVPVVSGLCRCCGETKRCRILNGAYEWQGRKEVYSEMFVDCFGLLLPNLEGDVAERLICLTCVSQLRKAASFRRQVLSFGERLLKTRIHMHSDDAVSELPAIHLKEEKVEIKIEEIDCTSIQPLEEPPSLKATVKSEVNIDMDCENTIKKNQFVKEEEKELKIIEINLNQPLKEAPSKLPDDLNTHEDVDDNLSLASLHTVRKEEFRVKQPKQLKKIPKLKTSKSKILQRGRSKRYQRCSDELTHPEVPLTPRRAYLETVEKAYSNTVTIVENSYVCPFTTSFSDYYCTYCNHTFMDPSKLREHTLEHDPKTFKVFYDNKKIAQIDISRIDCRLCPEQIDDVEVLKDHLQKVHEKFIFPVKNEFLKFKLTLSNLTCIECNATNFKFFHALKKHMAQHFGPWVCDICGAHYFIKKNLVLHQKIHQSTKELYPCKDCGKTFKTPGGRHSHETKIHKKEAGYRCSKCDEAFFSHSLRYRHLIDVHGEERKFPCDLCDRVYDSRKSLRGHNSRIHLKIMKHQCDLCDRKFYNPHRLKEHMSTHTGERNYRCEYCGKSYPRLRGLKVHMQSHLAEKKHKCKLCGVSYGQNVSLKNHVKRHHQSVEMADSSQSDLNLTSWK